MIRSFPLAFYGVPNMKCRASVTDDVMCCAMTQQCPMRPDIVNPL